MRLGIALMVAGTLGVAALGSTLAAAASDGVFAIGAVSMTPRAAALLSSAVAIAATVTFLLGLGGAARARRRHADRTSVDERAVEAERDARARLLTMRLEQLERELEVLERRRAVALGELNSSTVLIDGDDGDEPVVVVLEDGQEPTVLGRPLADARRSTLPA